MNFTEILLRAKADEQVAKEILLEMYRPLLLKEAIVYGIFDEDLHQELLVIFLHCIQRFRV